MSAKKRITIFVTLISALFAANAYAEATDPAASATVLRYESAFSDYRAQQDIPLLPWNTLFTVDGGFADSAPQVTPMANSDNNAAERMPQTKDAPAMVSDTRGRIEAININEGKVKLKHGPIPKFDMPGMTMQFRVQDPKLLTQIKVGDEVGVTMDEIGNGLVITGFQK